MLIENVANFATAGLQHVLAAMNVVLIRNHFITGPSIKDVCMTGEGDSENADNGKEGFQHMRTSAM